MCFVLLFSLIPTIVFGLCDFLSGTKNPVLAFCLPVCDFQFHVHSNNLALRTTNNSGIDLEMIVHFVTNLLDKRFSFFRFQPRPNPNLGLGET